MLQHGHPQKDESTWEKIRKKKDERKKWRQKIIEARDHLSDLVDDFVRKKSAGGVDDVKAASTLVENLLQGVEFIVVETESDDEAFRIFESLNWRGLELSAGDLLKNYLLNLLRVGSPARDQMRREWEKMEAALGDRLTAFIRHYYMSQHGRTTKRDLYEQLVDLLEASSDKEAEAQRFLSVLREASDFYGRLIEPDADGWSNHDLLLSLKHLSDLGTTQWTPIALAANALKVPENEVAKLVRRLEILIVRKSTVGRTNPNSYEGEFSDPAIKLYVSRERGSDAITKVLSEIHGAIEAMIPSDDVFAEDLIRMTNVS